MRRLLGLKDLIHDAIEKTTDLVEETHESVAEKSIRMLSISPALGEAARAVDQARRLTTAAVFSTIRATNQGIRGVEDTGVALARAAATDAGLMPASLGAENEGLATPQSSSAQGTLSWWVDIAQGALNAAFGDFLRDRENGLEIRMGFRHAGRHVEPAELRLALGASSPKLCIFVHGLGCTEWAWSFRAADLHGDPETNFGTLLAQDLGFVPVYVRYNTGLHVSENGRRLSELIEELTRAHPGEAPEIALIGHSMGGLVARSAAHYGNEGKASWISALTHVFSIGSPHLGAPLEKASNALASVLGFFDTPGTQVPAKILNARSRGIKDLRFGYTVDEEWKDLPADAFLADNRSDVPFVDSALYCFVASTLTRDPNHPVGQLIGDVLVRLPSAAGLTPEPARRLPFHIGRVFGGLNHFELANHPDVYAEIRRWLAEETRGGQTTRALGSPRTGEP